MSHNHSHDGCHNESHDHDHDHSIPESQGYRDNLFSRVDRQNVVALNAEDPGQGPEVIKAWDERLDEENVRIHTYCYTLSTLRLILRSRSEAVLAI